MRRVDEFLTVGEIAKLLRVNQQTSATGSTAASSGGCASAHDGFASGNPSWTRFSLPAQPVCPSTATTQRRSN